MISTFLTVDKKRCLFGPLSLKPRLVMARPPDIDGRDGGGAAKGSPEQNILWAVLHYRPPIYLCVIRFVLLVRCGTGRLGGVFLGLLACRRRQSEGRPQKSWAADQMVAGTRAHYESVEITGTPLF